MIMLHVYLKYIKPEAEPVLILTSCGWHLEPVLTSFLCLGLIYFIRKHIHGFFLVLVDSSKNVRLVQTRGDFSVGYLPCTTMAQSIVCRVLSILGAPSLSEKKNPRFPSRSTFLFILTPPNIAVWFFASRYQHFDSTALCSVMLQTDPFQSPQEFPIHRLESPFHPVCFV